MGPSTGRWRILDQILNGQRGWADEFARRLVEDFARGWHFDADARHFTDPTTTTPDEDAGEDAGVSFYDLVVDYAARKWRGWAPASRRNAVRERTFMAPRSR